MKPALLLLFVAFLFSCGQKNEKTLATKTVDIREFYKDVPALYSPITSENMYSGVVKDTFRIYSALPKGYDEKKKYPLVILLDANAYFEPFVAETKLATITADIPPLIITGIGYKDFGAMDSLRTRDYTSVARKDEPGFGGSGKFARFINEELLPKLCKQYKVNADTVILIGHSFGGVCTLHYLFDGYKNGKLDIQNFISASPPLEDDNRLLFEMESQAAASKNDLPFKLYLSKGTLDVDSGAKSDALTDLQKQMVSHHYKKGKFKFVAYGNFEHLDAAMPGFMKGLSYVFEK